MEFFANLFEPVVVIFRTVFGLFYDVTASAGFPSYGIAIILMTIVVKMALYPLTEKQIRSMKAMQEIQPALKKIQKDIRIILSSCSRKWVSFIRNLVLIH